jgi:HK97 family phage major capsid protein
LACLSGQRGPEYAKNELHLCKRLEAMQLDNDNYTRYNNIAGKSFLAPFATDLMCKSHKSDDGFTDFNNLDYEDNSFRAEVKSMLRAGAETRDPEEIFYWAKRYSDSRFRGDTKAAQSWMDETLGGALVAPPEFGELIQLFRNKDALINAGARVVPLPPSGRLKYPRQTAPTTGYWVGEGTTTGGITQSNFNTGSLLLEGKKCAALVYVNNELIRFASPATEAVLRADMTKTLSLTADFAGLQGVGSTTQPLGLVNTTNVVSSTPTTAPSGNNLGKISPQDIYTMIGQIEANNGEFQGWILRPELFYALVGARAGTWNGTTQVQQGQFVMDQFRGVGQGFGPIVAGFKATTTPQCPRNRIQGTTTNGTVMFGGQWDDYIMAMFGSIEFAQATQGDTMFANDQTLVRAILTIDMAPRHPGVFAFFDKIDIVMGL